MRDDEYEEGLLQTGGGIDYFSANDVVAACWGVACSVDKANAYEKRIGKYAKGILDHGQDHCGRADNQVIFDTDNDGTADKMIETGTDGLGNLECTIYTDSNYLTPRNVSDVKTGQYIYWTTSAGSKTWHHQGEVYSTVPGHPNRS